MTDMNFRPDPARAPTDFHRWFSDFDFYLATDWVITTTEAGGGDATEAISQAAGGILVVTNDLADDDNDFLQARDVASGQVAEHWLFDADKSLYFGIRFKVSDATQCDFVAGLQITDTSPLAVSDGIYFRKDDGDTLVDLVAIKDSSASTSTGVSGVSGYLADGTYTTLQFFYDPSAGTITGYQDGVAFASVPTTYAPDDEELAISFGIQNGAAAAKVLYIDWIDVWQER